MESEKPPILCVAMRSVYLIAIIVFSILGIFLNVTRTESNYIVFAYYTIQSNVVCIVAALIYLFQLFSQKKLTEAVMACMNGGVVMCIMLTFLVFHFVLLPTISPDSDILGAGNSYVHYVVPLMIFGDYIVFQRKGLFTFKMISYWVLIPLAYCIFVFVFSAFGGRFGAEGHVVPYFFLDYTRFGIGGVALWIAVLAIGYIGLSALLVVLDKFLLQFMTLHRF